MSIKELIEELNKFNPNSEVHLMGGYENDLKVCDTSYGNKNRVLICEKPKQKELIEDEIEYIF